MSVLVLLSILVAAFCGVVAWMVARRGLATPLSRMLFPPVVLVLAFNLSQAAFFSAANPEEAWRLHVVGSTCWAIVMPLQLWLVLGLTRRSPLSRWWLVLLSVPAVVIAVRLATFPVNEGVVVVNTPLGWSRDFSGVPFWAWMVIGAVAGYAMVSLVILFRWWRRASSRRERRQAGWILWSGVAASLATGGFVAAYTMLRTPTIPQIPHLFAAIWVGGYAVAIRRYRLIPVSSSQAVGAILAGIQDLVLLLDEQGRILEANPRSSGLLGFEAKALVGRNVESLARDPAEMEETVRLFLGRSAPEQDFETTWVTAEGLEIPVLVNGAAVLDREGDRVGVVVVVQDLRPMRESLKAERVESVGTLAGGIAHDFNNLLTAVSGFVSLAQMDAGDSRKVTALLAEASRACERAQGLTRQLLTFSRGGAPIRRATPLTDIVRESATFVGVGSNVRIDVESPPDLWLADADPGQVGQVVHNLVLNAVQAMPDGGTVRLSMTNVAAGEPGMDGSPVPADRVRLTVRDQGAGIPPDCIGRVFDPFFTTKKNGTGLGLATVFSIVRRHGGDIHIDSQVGRGTVVRIDLPRSRRPTRDQPAVAGKDWKTAGRILVMDDQLGVLRVAEEMLSRLGFEVVSCTDGEAALGAHQAALDAGRPFDAVILDLTIPGGMGGAEVIGVLRSLQPDLKAVVSSGYAPDAVMADYRERGFDAVLPKPYSMERLQGVLWRILQPGKRRVAREAERPVRSPGAP